jgi:DNA-binding transcriptional MocR family regulator
VLDIGFQPCRGGDVPLGRQLADHLAALIMAGRLPVGTRLPPTREVAAALGLGRNTVTGAYQQLATRGLVGGEVGRGTFVAARPVAGGTATAPRGAGQELGWAGLFSRAGLAVRLPTAFRGAERDGPVAYDFRGGRVDADALPAHDLAWAFARPFRTRAGLRALASHQDPFGWPPLRREIATRLADRGIVCEPADVAVVSGLQQAIDLVMRVLVDPGDAVALEQPGYFGAALAAAGRGADLLGVEVDRDGLRTDRLARLLRVRRVKLVYVTPAAQSPTGVVMSPTRREALLALANEHQVPVFEDDYDSELRWTTPASPALKAGDRAGHVIYAGTFSKALFPGLRVGYVVAPRALLHRLVASRFLSDFGTAVVEQAALATLLATRGLERHVRRIRRLYQARRDALVAALDAQMPAGTRCSRPRGGHLVWVSLPAGTDPDRLRQEAAARDVAYTPGEIFHADGAGAEHVALAFTTLDTAAIRAGVARFAAAVRAAGGGTRRRRSERAAGRRAPASRGHRKEVADARR